MTLSRILLSPFYSIYEKSLIRQVDISNTPNHIGIILDGNRRFARSIDVPLKDGYEYGSKKLEDVLEWMWDLDIEIVSIWIFSTENFKRDADQVGTIMQMAEQKTIHIREDKKIHDRGVRIRYSGDRSSLSESLLKQIDETEERTKKYKNHTLNICLAYGGREEITTAIKNIAREVCEGKLEIDAIDEKIVEQYLYTSGLPDPDLIIRTSGSIRTSGFLMWQSAYSELFFTDVLWPAFRKLDLLRAIRNFQARKRNFGK